ncbi:MAG: MerR family transcriptional regulator [Anaerocolumna sp.]
MRTVKEIANLTGVSVRTLHYYDQIDLLKPSELTKSGYRLYNDQDVKILQPILFLKELAFPLKSISAMIYNNDDEKKKYLLEKQKELLILKRDRLTELINLMDNLKKGDKNMSFKEFDTSQIDAVFTSMLDKFNEEQRNSYILEHGGNIENAKKDFEENLNKNRVALDRYAGDQNLAEMVKNAPTADDIAQAQEKIQELNRLLAKKMNCSIDDDAVQNFILKLRDAHNLIFPVNKIDNLFKDLGIFYLENEAAVKVYDEQYGTGFAKFFGEAVLYFYK